MTEREPEVDIERTGRKGQIFERVPPARGQGEGPLASVLGEPAQWSGIWGGLMVSVITLVILGCFVTAVGLAAYGPAGRPPAGAGTWFISLIISLIAAFLGGMAAGSGLPRQASQGRAIMQGVYLAGLILTFSLVLGLFGTAAGGAALAAMGTPLAGLPPATIAANMATAAGWMTVISILTVVVAALGSMAALRRQQEPRQHNKAA